MSNRDFSGVLHSNERNYLDRLWRNLGVDPLDQRVEMIEARLVRATLAYQAEVSRELQAKFLGTAGVVQG